MHLLVLTDEKCQLSCLYLGVFALFICFISACCSQPLTAAGPLLSEHTHTSIKMHAPTTHRHTHTFFQTVSSHWVRWLTHSLTSEASVRVWDCVCMVHWYSKDIQCTRMPAVCPRGVSCWWQRMHTHPHKRTHKRPPPFVRLLFLSWPGCTLSSPGM